MSWRMEKSRSPIGLDVGRRQVKAAQFRRDSGAWRLEGAAACPRAGAANAVDRAEARRLRQWLGEQGLHGRAIVLAVPGDKLMAGILELPPQDSGAPIEVLARIELARMHRCEPGTFEMACWDLPAPARASNATFVMGAACAHADADALLDVFEQEGFDVRRLEVQAQAAARSCRPLLTDVSGIAGILDVGWTAARLILLYRHTVVYERKLARSGLWALAEAVAAQRGLEPADVERLLTAGELGAEARAGEPPPDDEMGTYLAGLTEEMRIPMSYLSSQYPDARLQRLVIIGGGGRMATLWGRLAAALETEVHVAMPSDLANCAKCVDDEYGPTLAMAFGLARSEES